MKIRLYSVFVSLLCSILVAGAAFAASPDVVISQIYGAGGNAGAARTHDFVELFNRGNAPVSLAGWSLQYASSTGTGAFGNGATQLTELPAVTLLPGQYYLVQEAGGATGAPLPTPDHVDPTPISMAAGAGKVALAKIAVSLGCNGSSTPCSAAQLANIVDVVGYGAANYFEGSGPTAAPTTSLSVFRKANGCQDTDNNAADFATAAVAPRNSASATAVCGNAAPSIAAPSNPAAVVLQDAAPFTVNLTGADDNSVFNWSASAGSGVSAVIVSAGQGTSSATFTVTVQAGFTGTASFTASLSDNVNAPVNQAVNVQVNPNVVNNAPSIDAPPSPITTVMQDAAPFTAGLTGSDDNNAFTWGASTGTGVANVTVTAGQGTSAATFTVTLQSGFSGTATFTASLSDGFNAAVTQPVTITVNPLPPPPLDHVVISQIYGGGGNGGATYRNDYVELYNASTTAFDLGGWTIQYASATGTTWQAQPLGGIMQPGEYYLVQLASGGAVGADLPAANVLGDINISGTTGKIALVMGGDPLEGCPTGDPLLVDLVGYGGANCREGAANAPSPSNTTAAFRKNGGFTDTNVNSADFVTGVPNPRRTTPIVEIGPYVLSVDPRKNATTAARDASINVTFTEAVNVDSGWYTINCVSTGNHDSATIATVAGFGRTWIITPNANFLAGEQCTVTIFKDAIHDQDFDDANADTDTLKANYTYTFTVATGTAPAYSADVHLTFGNPSSAVADLFTPNNFLMEKPELTLSYNRDRGTPNWVSWHLDTTWVGSLQRVDTFRPDPAVPAEWYRVLHTDYQSSGFDRGHMVPNADRDKETSIPINQATFLMTNMIPQSPDNNQGPWADMENDLRALLGPNELYIVAGGAGTGGAGSNGFATTIANGKVTVPASTWKCALVLPAMAGDDLARVTGATRTICVIMPNIQGIRNADWQNYLTSVNAVETLSGYDLFANLPNAVENAVEAGVNGSNPPGAADSSVSTDEDTAASVTLDAAAGSNSSINYTIVNGPANGTLSGTGANRTYTPAPDFNGTDSFTFRVSDNGTLMSDLATVTVTVDAVNDAPVATVTVPATSFEGSAVTATVSVTDVDSASFTYAWTVTKNGSPFATGAGNSITFTPNDNGAYGVSVTATDSNGGYGSDSAAVTVGNVAPAITAVSGPSAYIPAGTAAAVSVTYTDAGSADTHSATFTWDDGTSSTVACASGVCSASHPFAAAGVYSVSIVLTDDDGGAATASFNSIVVVDRNAGKVTGGGWINTTAGRATINVSAQYDKNDVAPKGNTQFKVDGYELKSTSYDWLVVSGTTAQYRGTATINGTGSYGFLVTVVDGSPDKFRIRVWELSTGTTLFDTVPGGSDDLDAANPQPIGGGNITVH